MEIFTFGFGAETKDASGKFTRRGKLASLATIEQGVKVRPGFWVAHKYKEEVDKFLKFKEADQCIESGGAILFVSGSGGYCGLGRDRAREIHRHSKGRCLVFPGNIDLFLDFHFDNRSPNNRLRNFFDRIGTGKLGNSIPWELLVPGFPFEILALALLARAVGGSGSRDGKACLTHPLTERAKQWQQENAEELRGQLAIWGDVAEFPSISVNSAQKIVATADAILQRW